MASLPFRIVNVFTQNLGKLTGNPLCVFENGDGLSDATMQALARQFNLSETTFILPSARGNARVRIFTPYYEMPFAGHPTLGTAFVCRALGRGGDELTLEMQAGLIPVRASGPRWTLTAKQPTWRTPKLSRGELAAMLGLETNDVGAQPRWVSTGREQLIIPLTSEAAVRRVRPDARACAQEPSQDGQAMAYVFAELGGNKLLSRFFFPSGPALLEDPATGSATANLGGFMIATERKRPCAFQISQGEYCGRPSTLFLDVDAQDRIHVGGDVLVLGRGTI